jgi:hypothetical protein
VSGTPDYRANSRPDENTLLQYITGITTRVHDLPRSLAACAAVSTNVSTVEWFEGGASLHDLNLKLICRNLELCSTRVPGDTSYYVAVLLYNCN